MTVLPSHMAAMLVGAPVRNFGVIDPVRDRFSGTSDHRGVVTVARASTRSAARLPQRFFTTEYHTRSATLSSASPSLA